MFTFKINGKKTLALKLKVNRIGLCFNYTRITIVKVYSKNQLNE